MVIFPFSFHREQFCTSLNDFVALVLNISPKMDFFLPLMSLTKFDKMPIPC